MFLMRRLLGMEHLAQSPPVGPASHCPHWPWRRCLSRWPCAPTAFAAVSPGGGVGPCAHGLITSGLIAVEAQPTSFPAALTPALRREQGAHLVMHGQFLGEPHPPLGGKMGREAAVPHLLVPITKSLPPRVSLKVCWQH